jgi:sporulation protein YlmC with PRC-barrel domain
MLNKSIAAALLASAVLAAPAYAQTGTSSQNTNNATSPTVSTTAPSAGTMGSGQFLTNEQTSGHMWRASKLKGVNIYGPNDEKVGDISDVLMDEQGNAKAVVIGVGGFLGMGEKDVALPFNSIQWVNESRNVAASNNAANTNAAGTARTTASGTVAPGTTAAPGTVARTDTTGTTVARNDNRSYPDHGKISMTKDQLKAAPTFRLER